MKQFTGFPTKMQFTPLPDFFFSALLPQISDITELKVTLHILRTLYHKRGYPRFVTLSELVGDKSLMSSLKEGSAPPKEALSHALGMASKRGTFLQVTADKGGETEEVYFLNTERDKEVVVKIQNNELQLAGLKAVKPAPVDTEEQPDIFTDYEENIGMITPRVADELSEAEKLYPKTWINEAIKEAALRNKRNWPYIAAILERWSTEGRSDGTHRRDSAKKEDPDKYIKGKYGHMVRR